jgi:hypothetical protein
VSVPLRYIVELRPPRKGERFLPVAINKAGDIFTAEVDWAYEERWVIVDPVPADPTPTGSGGVAAMRAAYGIIDAPDPYRAAADTRTAREAAACPVEPRTALDSTHTAEDEQ